MKIFNYEDGKKVVYVQMNEFGRLLHSEEIAIPACVMKEVFGDVLFISDHNRYEFKRFEDEHAVEFFESLDWIIDYKSVRDLTEEEILGKAEQINQEMSVVADKYNSMSEKERAKNYKLRCKFELLEHKHYSLRDIFWLKQGHLQMDIPVVADTSIPAIYSADRKYVASFGLNPQQLLIQKSDGSLFEKKENIDKEFHKKVLDELIKYNQENNQFFNEFTCKNLLSDDMKNYIVTLSIIVPQQEEQAELKEVLNSNVKSVKKENLLVRLIKKIRKN